MFNYFIDNWLKHIWETTMASYKIVLKYWQNGTGSGSGRIIMFEGWSDEKLDTFNVDEKTYKHTNVETRSAVPITGYNKQ